MRSLAHRVLSKASSPLAFFTARFSSPLGFLHGKVFLATRFIGFDVAVGHAMVTRRVSEAAAE
jgi:hypothetical protein